VAATRAKESRPLERPVGHGDTAQARRIGGWVYGTIVALAVDVADARAYPDDAWHAFVLLGATALVFWIAHVYADSLGESIARGGRLTVGEFRQVARHELAIVEAAVPSLVALSLGGIGVIETHTSYWLALAAGLFVLGVQGIRFARLERYGTLGTLTIVALNVGLGLLLVALKLVVTH
jgi:hypothetical protein